MDGSLTVISQGERAVAPLQRAAPFTEGISRHHRPFYDDYTVAKMHIAQAIGDLTDMDVFGRQVLCAVFCRPASQPIKKPDGTEGVLYLPVKEIKEDWYQHKVVLVLKTGPDAFKGDPSYLRAMFGDGVPAPVPGEWLFANANAGIQVNIAGEGGSRPQAVDRRGEPFDIFEWDGWPCRIIPDDQFFGRITKPHSVV